MIQSEPPEDYQNPPSARHSPPPDAGRTRGVRICSFIFRLATLEENFNLAAN